ncbi:agamous-like MADS-box protein AGL80 [Eutrema salsugineum]|uniref:agamous-like MADS-box protein AGL80 n=1 Tax=Eutrema salsugineum TaxID=72664 RepID=UPI000CED18D2|nr:agamous-like MADS-box protein AGL80 [Eutrema salsugineum]
MTRKKVKLAFIENNSSRKSTFQKRKKGILKKVKEISTLCGVTTCAIIYSPYTSNPDVWPSISGVRRVVSDFQTLPEMDQQKKMVDQETFLRQRIAKLSENLRRQEKDNREQEMIEIMFQCWDGSLERFHLNILDLNELGYVTGQYQKDINRKIEILESSSMEMGESSNTAVTAAMAHSFEGIGSLAVASATTDSIQQQQHHHQHQQFRHTATPHVGFYEQTRNMNLNQIHSRIQQQPFMEMMNHPDQMNDAYEYMDNFHQHQHQQQQQIPSDSSTALTTVSSNSIIHVTSPNPTNNTWFH